QLNVRKRFSTMVSDDGEVLACALKINNTPVEYMNFSESPCNDCTASVDYTFTSRGSYSVLARCLDNDGNAKEGEPVNISIGQNCPDCHANNTDRCETPPKCEKDCGADSQCDEKERNSSWTSSGNTCNGCGNGCNYSIDTQKPEAYKLINDDCYYGCSVSCGSNGWIKLYSSLVCSINSCPITKTSGNTCYSLRGCGIGGCTYLNADTNKGCSQSVCAESGWNNSACSQYNKELYITEGFNNSDDYISGYLFCDSDHLIVSGDCVPDDNNDKIISNWQTGSRGWFCEFECNGWCTADGTIKITCKP
ncbi:hypothetical protein KJ562_00295, partial [Patescibacteria group bacterium]|nr:hypothetical protein [Patescibacteria group bacterium]MBU4162080.1 hypothetical protein [Patescibacteria group bacterium]